MEEENAKKLRFTCTECGGVKLELVYDCLTARQEVTEVREDGSVCITGPIEIVEDHRHWYRCQDCKASPVDWETGEPIWKDDSVLAEWLIENCPQLHEDLSLSADKGVTD
jgi:hypothetical protein